MKTKITIFLTVVANVAALFGLTMISVTAHAATLHGLGPSLTPTTMMSTLHGFFNNYHYAGNVVA